MKTQRTKSKYRWPITIGLVFGTAIVIAFAFLYKLPAHSRGESAEDSKQKINTEFISVTTVNKKSESPYLKTGFENVYLSIDSDGDISYYEFVKERFNSLKSKETLTVSLTIGDEKIHVDLHLIKKGDKTEGYGLYSDPESKTCPYLFLRLTDNQITSDAYKYLVYSDRDYKNLYSNHKTYQMIYALNPEKKAVKRLLSDQGQPVDKNGLPSTSFILIPDSFVGQKTDGFYFLSDRNTKGTGTYELYKKADFSSPELMITKGICKPDLIAHDGNTYYFKSDENDESQFALYKHSGSSEQQIKHFYGDASNSLVHEDYLLNYSNKAVYNLFSNEEYPISVPISIVDIQDFDINIAKDKLAIIGTFAGNTEKILFCRLADSNYKEKFKIFDNRNLFISNNSNLTFMGDYIYLMAPSEDDDKVNNYVISWDAIFSIK